MTQGQPVCVVETTKATVEVEAPGAGTIVQLYAEDVEVELGKTIAYVAETADELASIDAGARRSPRRSRLPATARRRGRPSSSRSCTGSTLSAIEKRGFITEKDVEELIARQKASAPPSRGPIARRRLDRRRVVAGDVRSRTRTSARSTRRSSSRFARSRGVPGARAGREGDGAARRRCADRRRRRPRRGLAGRRAASRHRGRRPARAARDDRAARRSSRSASSRSSAQISSSAAAARSSAPGSGAAARSASEAAVIATRGRR